MWFLWVFTSKTLPQTSQNIPPHLPKPPPEPPKTSPKTALIAPRINKEKINISLYSTDGKWTFWFVPEASGTFLAGSGDEILRRIRI